MSDTRNCPRCHAQLPAGTPPESCPSCLLQLGAQPSEPGGATVTRVAGLPPVPTPEELAPHFEQLEIRRLIGRGGMGVVYEARQKSLDRTVALKLLHVDPGSGPDFAERFAREARALASLSHPSIVTIHDFGQAGPHYYLLMEYVEGANLRQLIRSKEIRPAQALDIVGQICEALQFAHDEGVVHRDIKPENILIDTRGRVKIADFGLAKILGLAPDEIPLTGIRQAMGTAHYMAPEQVEHPLEVDHRADIYSLGVVFYELLTGELPLGRFAEPSRKVEVDVRIDEIVMRTLEKEPELRYQQASQVGTDLRNTGKARPRRRSAHERSGAISSNLGHTAKLLLTVATVLAVVALAFLGLKRALAPRSTPEAPRVSSSRSTPDPAASGLIKAAQDGSIEGVRTILDRGADANIRDPYGGRALVRAAYHDQLEAVLLLLDRGADPNLPGGSDETALCNAVGAGDIEIVRVLLGAGADPNLPGLGGRTPLIEATRRDRIDVMRLLLASGADPNESGPLETTALIDATQAGNEAAVRLLLDAGADLDAKGARGDATLVAAAAGRDELLALFRQSSEARKRGQSFSAEAQALVEAARAGDWLRVQAMLSSGIDADGPALDGDRGLVAAARGEHAQVVTGLIRFGVDVNARGRDGTTALLEAIESGNVNVVKPLLSAGADPNLARSDGSTPLIAAAKRGRADLAIWLLKAGADPDALGAGGTTALIEAAELGSLATARALLEAGASLTLRGERGDALKIAASMEHQNVVDLLQAESDRRSKLAELELEERRLRAASAPSGN